MGRSKDGLFYLLGGLTTLFLAVAVYAVFLYAPTERYMGDVQRLFYFHVGSAWNAYLAFAVTMLCSIMYLWRRNVKWDRLAVPSAELGVLFTTLVLITGPLWAKPVWNAWWRWDDPRLVSTLILWFIYVGYLFLRASIGGDRGKRIAAVFGIVGFVDVPIVHYSVQWWSSIHPNVVTEQGIQMDERMILTMFITMLAFMLLFCYLLWLGYFAEKNRQEIESLREWAS